MCKIRQTESILQSFHKTTDLQHILQSHVEITSMIASAINEVCDVPSAALSILAFYENEPIIN